MATAGVGILRVRTRSQRRTGFQIASCIAGALAALLALPLVAQIRPGFRGSGSKYPEFYQLPPTGGPQTNRLKGMFLGNEWQHLSNKVFRVNGMKIEHYEWSGATNLVAVAPECLFDAEARVAWSTGRLDLTGLSGGVTIRGASGFFARMGDSTLILTNKVRTTIQRELIGPITP